jgi:hypothetical protein
MTIKIRIDRTVSATYYGLVLLTQDFEYDTLCTLTFQLSLLPLSQLEHVG